MRHSGREWLLAIAFGLGFSIAVMGLGALASEMGDPWGVFVLAVLAPGMPFLGNRGDSLLPALVMCFVAWASAGALIWMGFIRPIVVAWRYLEEPGNRRAFGAEQREASLSLSSTAMQPWDGATALIPGVCAD